MPLPRNVVWSLLIALMVSGAARVYGQTASTGPGQAYPNKPIRIVIPGVGGGTDFTARLIAQGISGPLGQHLIIDARGAGVVPGQIVSTASPDGYTLLIAGTSFLVGTLFENTGYDPVRDFSTISLIVRQPNVLVIHPSLPIKSVKELLALAKAKPGTLNYASAATGSSSHLAAELFKAMAGVNIVRINYKGGATIVTDLIGGQVQLMFATSALVAPHIKSGKLTALAVTSAEPSALLPGLPTVAASGVPGYESVGMTGMFAPAKTPAVIINRLNQEVVRVLNLADIKERFFNAGVETVGSSPQEYAAKIKSELARLGKVVKDAGIRDE